MGGMAHNFARCRKSNGKCLQRSILLPEEPPDESEEWLPIEQEDPVYDKETEAVDAIKQVVDGKYQITYVKRLMTDKELSEVIK